MKRLLFLLMVAAAIAQTPSINTPMLYGCYHAGSSITWTCAYAVMDPPLQLSLDSANKLHVGMAPEYTCYVQDDVYTGTQLPQYPLKQPVNRTVPVSVYVNGLAQYPDDFSSDWQNVTLNFQYDNPKILIRYCTTAKP